MNKKLFSSSLLMTAFGLSSMQAVTVLVDVQGASGVVSTASDFQINDPNVSATAPVNFITSAGTSVTSDGITVGISGGGGPGNYHADPASPADPYQGVAILEGYQFTFQADNRTISLSGLSSIPAGQLVTLTLYGAADSVGSNTTFVGTLDPGGADTALGSVSTGVEDAVDNPGFLPTGQLTWTADGTTDTAAIVWGNAGSSGGVGFNGLSLTSVPEPSSVFLGFIALGGAVLRRRR